MRVIDLSHRLEASVPVYPGDEPVSLQRSRAAERDGYTAFILRSGLHAATHLDMPAHMTGDVRAAADFDPALFMGVGTLLDVRGENPIAMKPAYHDLTLAGRIVLLWTGWGERFEQPDYFTGYPAVSEELARFLLRGGIKMLGIDAPAPDYPPFDIHTLLLENGVFLLENAAHLEALEGVRRFIVSALPIKIDAEASFTRAVALTEEG